MARELKVGVAIEAKDGFSAGAGKVAAASRRLSEQLEAGQRRLAELGARDASLKRLDALGSRLGKTSAGMDEAARKTAALRRELKAAEQPSKKLERAFEAARAKSTALRREHVRQRDELRDLRRELREAGVDTRDLGEAQRDAGGDFERAARKMQDASGATERLGAANRAWEQQTARMAQISLAAEGVGRVGSRMREIGFAPIELARPVAEAQGRLAQLGLSEEAVDLITRRGRELSGELPELDTRRFIDAAYAIKSGIGSLDAGGVADMAEMAAITARASVGDPEGTASLFTRGHANFRQLFPELSDRQFGGALGALVTKAAQDYKTTGPEMEQAIERLGAGMSLLGISAGEQFAMLGMLQDSLGAAEAATRAAVLVGSAAAAQGNLEESGRDVRILDERGNLLPPSELVNAMRAEFGAWSSAVGGELQKAFGSSQAVEVFQQLWNRGDELGRAGRDFDRSAQGGEALVRMVQANRDDNAHARMQLIEQRMTATMEQVGASQLKQIEAPIGLVEKLLNSVEDRFGAAPIGMGMLVGGALGTLAETAAYLTVGGYGVKMAKTWWDRRSARTDAARKIRDVETRPRPGAFQRVSERAGELRKGGWQGVLTAARDTGRGIPGKTLQGLKGKGGWLGVAAGAVSLGSILASDRMSGREKTEAAGEELGGIGGAAIGGIGGSILAGAIAGSVVPGLGTAAGALVGLAGALVGGYAGYSGGSALVGGGTRLLTGALYGDEPGGDEPRRIGEPAPASGRIGEPAVEAGTASARERPGQPPAPAPGGLAPGRPEPSVVVHQYNNAPVAQITVRALPGEDTEDLARRVARLLAEMQGERERGALADAY